MSTGPPAQDQVNFVETNIFFSFYLELYKKNIFKNLIRPVSSNSHFEDCRGFT